MGEDARDHLGDRTDPGPREGPEERTKASEGGGAAGHERGRRARGTVPRVSDGRTQE